MAEALGLASSDAGGLAGAVDEVASNVIRQAFEPGQRGSFDIALLRRPGQLVVAVEDQGLPFDYKDLEARGEPGLNTPALTAFADTVRFVNLGPRGNRV